jgi:hypothetical protein
LVINPLLRFENAQTLTDEDFAKIRALKLKRALEPMTKARKRTANQVEESEEEDEAPMVGCLRLLHF